MSQEVLSVRNGMKLEAKRKTMMESWRTGVDPAVPMPDGARRREEEVAMLQVTRSGSLAEKRRGLWVGSEEVCHLRCPVKLSWCVLLGLWHGRRGCVWRDAEEGRDCEEAAQACPQSRRQRRRQTREMEGEDGSVGAGPKEPEAWGVGRRGGSGLLPLEPAASPSPTSTEKQQLYVSLGDNLKVKIRSRMALIQLSLPPSVAPGRGQLTGIRSFLSSHHQQMKKLLQSTLCIWTALPGPLIDPQPLQ